MNKKSYSILNIDEEVRCYLINNHYKIKSQNHALDFADYGEYGKFTITQVELDSESLLALKLMFPNIVYVSLETIEYLITPKRADGLLTLIQNLGSQS